MKIKISMAKQWQMIVLLFIQNQVFTFTNVTHINDNKKKDLVSVTNQSSSSSSSLSRLSESISFDDHHIISLLLNVQIY